MFVRQMFCALGLAVALLGVAPPAQTTLTGAPEILSVSVEPAHIRLGSPITATVETSTDVVSVRAHVAIFDFSLPKERDGIFSGTTTVPKWARFFHGNYAVKFTAQTSTGAKTQASTTVAI